jgi:predicted RNA-binding protein with PUA-like domain
VGYARAPMAKQKASASTKKRAKVVRSKPKKPKAASKATSKPKAGKGTPPKKPVVRASAKVALPEGGLLASIPRHGLWLMKSEPDVYGIADLERDGRTGWDSVRNFMARNFMKDEMRVGDLDLYYHSNSEPSGVAGLARVAGPPRSDPTQFDPKSEYFDATSPAEAPRWILVDVAFVERFERVVSLDELKADRALDGMLVSRKGMRLSVQPVVREHFARVLELAGAQTRL